MKEYIERESVNALIKAECSPKVAAYLIDAVATIPAADVRHVVTCGECIYFRLNSCMRWAEGTFMERTDFCSRAAKREES